MRTLMGLSTVVVDLTIYFAYNVSNNINVNKHNYDVHL